MAIEWQDELAIGNLELDRQHQSIFERYNAFSRSCEDGSGYDEILKMLDFLDNYTKEHFTFEEQLQKKHNYPGLAEQQTQHRYFLMELAAIREKFTREGPTKESVISTKGKLIRWLVQHIKHTDKELGNFLRDQEP